MTKALRKAIYYEKVLTRKQICKNKTTENLKNLIKNKEVSAVNYIKKEKKCYERQDLNNVIDNKKFWKAVKPYLSDKYTTFPKISLVENGEIR